MKVQAHSLTTAVHAGTDLSRHFGALSVPVYHASAFAFENAELGSAIHEGEIPGYFYGRISNPTQDALEQALCELERGEAALACSSGMGAISNGLLTLLKQGEHIIAPQSIYASTGSFLKFLADRFGIELTLVDATRAQAYRDAIQSNTRLLYLESPANPTLQITDIEAVVAIAREHDLITIMDNTFATPIKQQPLTRGVDLVVHSLTKYISGHADILGGALIGSKDIIDACRWETNKYLGAVISPESAWLALRGVRTLALRMEQHNANALAIARFLESHNQVKRVHYPGLESHPQHALAASQMRGFGGMIAFEVENLEAGRKLVNALKLCTLAVSLGDVSTLIQHSASMTHASVPEDQRRKAGISEGLLRLSVGIEHADDLINDLNQGLNLLAS